MKVDQYEIEYTDATTGQRVVKEVAGGELARKTAKALARSSGKRVLVRKAPKRPWVVYHADLEKGEVARLKGRLSMMEAVEAFEFCNRMARKDQAVLVFWPAWAIDRLDILAKLAG